MLFLGWGIAMTAVYASRSTVCDTATTCAALGLPASMCDASGVRFMEVLVHRLQTARMQTHAALIQLAPRSVHAATHEYLQPV